MGNGRFILLAALLAVAFIPVAWKKPAVQDGYRVVSYDGSHKTWTIIHTSTLSGRQVTKRFVVGCEYDTDSCHLEVGHLIVLNQLDPTSAQYVDVYEFEETLTISEGPDPAKAQHFDVLKEELLTDEPAT